MPPPDAVFDVLVTLAMLSFGMYGIFADRLLGVVESYSESIAALRAKARDYAAARLEDWRYEGQGKDGAVIRVESGGFRRSPQEAGKKPSVVSWPNSPRNLTGPPGLWALRRAARAVRPREEEILGHRQAIQAVLSDEQLSLRDEAATLIEMLAQARFWRRGQAFLAFTAAAAAIAAITARFVPLAH